MRSLRSIILVNFGFLVAAALLLVGVSAVVLADIDREAALPFVLAYSVGALLVFLGFGAWLVRQMMLRPLAVLAQTADALAEGGPTVPAPPYEVREFQALDDRFRAMAVRLLDAQGQVVRAEPFPEARKPALKLWVDFGPGIGEKKSSAQITRHYTVENVVGRRVMAVVNFPPRQIGKVLSEVLVLGVPDADGEVVLLVPDLEVPLGGRMY